MFKVVEINDWPLTLIGKIIGWLNGHFVWKKTGWPSTILIEINGCSSGDSKLTQQSLIVLNPT